MCEADILAKRIVGMLEKHAIVDGRLDLERAQALVSATLGQLEPEEEYAMSAMSE